MNPQAKSKRGKTYGPEATLAFHRCVSPRTQRAFGSQYTAAATMLCLLLSSAMANAAQPWTSIGSAGIVDETGNVSFNGGIAFVNSNSAVIRYNIVAVEGLFANLPGGPVQLPANAFMSATFRDKGAGDQVILRLKRQALDGSATTTLLTIDSNSYPGSNSYQTRSAICGPAGFDFNNYAYYVEATMILGSLPVAPALANIQVGKMTTPCLGTPG